MPYQIKKVEKGWKVFTKGTDDAHSNKPLSLANAKAQMKALYANADDSELQGGMIGGFDDDDFERLFGMFGGAEEDDDEVEKPKDDSDALLKLDKDAASFDVEEATGEPEYIKQAKKFAKAAGYKDWNTLKLADDGKHKLVLRGVKFGSITNNDYIIYKQHFPTIADVKRKQYLARATKIKGDWKKDKYSPNSLAINILWDGSNKKGGVDWAGLIGDAVKDGVSAVGDFLLTPEQREEKRKVAEACKICISGKTGGDATALLKSVFMPTSMQQNPNNSISQALFNSALGSLTKSIFGGEKKMNFRKDGDDPRNWGYDEDVYIGLDGKPISKDEYQEQFKSPVEPDLPEQPQFVGDPTQFKPQPYDPTNPLMYMVGGAVPLNKKLYERAKAEVYPRYKKPSAYRSGAVVKRYKDLGGKFKDNGGRPLARWFAEEWRDVGNQAYPVYRPTKRITKDTPLTPKEIDPENLKLQIREKQDIKGDANLKPFEAKTGGRIEPKNAAKADAEDMKEAKQILKKVAGDGSATIKKIEATPMGDNNIRQYLPNARVFTYKELADVSSIEELLPKPKDYFFLLYEHSPNVGHFVVVNRYIDNGRDTICFFCSYGSKIDAPLYWNSPATNAKLGQSKPYLSELLRKSGKKLQYNNVQYQSKQSPVATCGAFATLWIKANLRDNMNLRDFHDWITEIKNETGLTYDNIAANAISAR